MTKKKKSYLKKKNMWETICFFDHDVRGVQIPHNDTINVLMLIANYDVKNPCR